MDDDHRWISLGIVHGGKDRLGQCESFRPWNGGILDRADECDAVGTCIHLRQRIASSGEVGLARLFFCGGFGNAASDQREKQSSADEASQVAECFFHSSFFKIFSRPPSVGSISIRPADFAGAEGGGASLCFGVLGADDTGGRGPAG